MKTLFLAAGPMNWYSSKARCYWIAERMKDAKAIQYEVATIEDYAAAENVIFQKVFDANAAKTLREAGKKVFWDVCDPLWWFDPDSSRAILNYVDGVVCSNDGLAEDFRNWSYNKVPTYTIADRVRLEQYPLRRKHRQVNPLRLIWFGLGVNRFALMGSLAVFERAVANGYKMELTIQDDQPGANWQHITPSFPIYHVQFRVESENQVLASHDVAVLPPYPGAWGKVKSNNRAITAWACGLPVIDGFDFDSLEAMFDPQVRQARADFCYRELKENWLIEKSAQEWEALCASQ